MNIEELRNFCLSLKGTSEKMPFDDKILAFYVMNKMFCLTNLHLFESINIKCDPDEALLLREEFEEVIPGYHMNKKHWNTVNVKGKIPDKLLKKWIVNSYNLVIKGLPKKVKLQLSNL